MIRPIDIRLNAAHPELPLAEAVTFTGAPSTVLVRGVPPNCGRWAITAVSVAATYPDGSTTTRAAVQSANGVWVATLPATAQSGRTANGLRVLADGIDENGAAVTGYILGVADFAVASLGVAPAPDPGGIAYALRYFDALPDPAKKGDVTRIDGDLKFYNGAEWLPFTDLSDYYTKEQVDEAIDKLAAYYITSDAQGNPFATHAALVNAQTYYSGGAVRVPTRNDYCVVLADETHDNAEYRYIYAVAEGQTTGSWQPQYPVEGVMTVDQTVQKNSQNPVSGGGVWSAIWGALTALPAGFASLYDWCVSQLAGKATKADATLTERGPNKDGFGDWTIVVSGGQAPNPYRIAKRGDQWVLQEDLDCEGEWIDASDPQGTPTSTLLVYDFMGLTYTATRTALQGYVLGSQTDTPLASEAEAEALRQGKQNAMTAQQLANIAAVSDALAFDATHTYEAGDPVVYNGTLYTFTATHTGAWTGSDVSAVDIIARLANVVHKTGDETIMGVKTFDGNAVVTGDMTVHGFTETMGVTLNDVARGYVGGDSSLDHIIHIRTFADTELGLPAGDVTIPRANGMVALTADLRYALTTKTIDNGAVTLDDRAINAVAVSSTLASLAVNFPTATSGKARDFGLRLTVASGITTAPQIVLPQGVVCENADGEAPEIGADGAATILYFTETASGVFLVKGEVLQTITA